MIQGLLEFEIATHLKPTPKTVAYRVLQAVTSSWFDHLETLVVLKVPMYSHRKVLLP
ncbi:MAG: hypothetical protein AAGF93_02165 [Cyanobacteria bacterium P01_H01_bin.105]